MVSEHRFSIDISILFVSHRNMASTQAPISMFSYTANQVPIFDGEHFDYWSSQMETLFISQDFWDIVVDGLPEPPQQQNDDDEAWTDAQQKEYKKNLKKDASALRFIQQGLSKAIYPRIHGVKRAKQAWDILKEGFHGNDKVTSIKLQFLWREFDNLSKKDSEGMQIYLTRVAEIVNQIRSLGDIIEERKVVQKVLRSLPSKYDYIVVAIEESKDLSAYAFHDLMSSLQVHEERIGRSSNQPLEQAFDSKMNFSSPNSRSQQLGREGSSQVKGDFVQGRGRAFRGRGSFQGKGRGSRKQNNQQRTVREIQVTKLQTQVFFAEFVERLIIIQVIVFSDAKVARTQTIRRGIVIIKTKIRRMKQTSLKMKVINFFLV